MSLIVAMRKKGKGGEGRKLAAEGERQQAGGSRRTNKRWGERRQVMLGRGAGAERASARQANMGRASAGRPIFFPYRSSDLKHFSSIKHLPN
jgi:hypothetical protein